MQTNRALKQMLTLIIRYFVFLSIDSIESFQADTEPYQPANISARGLLNLCSKPNYAYLRQHDVIVVNGAKFVMSQLTLYINITSSVYCISQRPWAGIHVFHHIQSINYKYPMNHAEIPGNIYDGLLLNRFHKKIYLIKNDIFT